MVNSQWKLIHDRYEEVVLGKEKKRTDFELPLDFGQPAPGCEHDECASLFSRLKVIYQKYMELLEELDLKNVDLDLYKKTVQILDSKNFALVNCLERESGLLAIAEKYNSESAPRVPCPECAHNKEQTHFLRCRYSHNSDKIMAMENMREQVVDDLKKQIETLTDKITEMRRKLMVKEDPFWRDVTICDLRQQIQHLKCIEEAPTQAGVAAEPPRVDNAKYVKIDPLSFPEPGAKEKLRLDPYIQRLAIGNPDHVFYDEQQFNERKLRSNPGFQSRNGASKVSESVKLAFHLSEMDKITAKFRTLEDENMKLASRNRELVAHCTVLEEEVSKMARQRGDLMTKLEQRNSLSSKLQDGPCKSRFVDFFRIVEGDCKCLDENTMYDAFFGQLTEQERLSCIEWMYASCHDGAKPRKRDLQEDNESRVGKKMFSSCLYAIGGVFKKAFNGRRNVWINIEMNDELVNPAKRQRTLSMDSV